MSKFTKNSKLEKIKNLLVERQYLDEIDAEVLAEDIYAIVNDGGGNFSELQDRVSAMEYKYDTMSEKLDRVARRLG